MADIPLENIMPAFDSENLKTTYAGRYRQFVDSINVQGLERATCLKTTSNPILYISNHQTCLDYFIPKYVILFDSLPFPRTIAGSNLNNLFFRNLVHDLNAGGIIWHNREDKSYAAMRNYHRAIESTFLSGTPVKAFPETKRNRNPKGNPLPFDTVFFRLMFDIEERVEKPIVVSSMACDYDEIPERQYYEKIDKTGRKSFSYYFWDIYAYQKWRWLKIKKGTARVNFGNPVLLDDLAGKGNKKEKAQRAAEESRTIVTELLHEIRQ